jgi:hypothetical protein
MVARVSRGDFYFFCTEGFDVAQARVFIGPQRGETTDPLGLATQTVGHFVRGPHAGFVRGNIALARLRCSALAGRRGDEPYA